MLKNMPIEPKDFSAGANVLLDFYTKLGWKSETHSLDPKKVKINDEEAEECLSLFVSSAKENERLSYGFLWVNQGPSSSADVPRGKVKLEKDWLIAD